MDYLPIPWETTMGQYQPLLWWILLFGINILMFKKKLEREGGITGISEVTLM